MKKPTIRQKTAASKLSESIRTGKNKPIGEILREANYSESTSKSPQRVTDSKGWQALMEKYIPDEKLQEVLEEGLRADKVISAVIVGSKANENTNDFIEVPDHPTRHKYLDTALKLKKKYPAEKTILAGDPDEPLQIEIIEAKRDD
jgi:hypothetical protein